jgi:nucleotide-binding universal stress UspA family protein
VTTRLQPAAEGSIVVGVDASEHGRRALAVALVTASRLGVGCHVVHAWVYPAMAMSSPYTAATACLTDLGPEELAWLEHMLAETDRHGVAVTDQIVHGGAGPALVDIAADLDAPFLFVGSVGHGAIVGTLLGSVSLYCVHHATCPVVIVPPADRAAPNGAPEWHDGAHGAAGAEEIPADTALRA